MRLLIGKGTKMENVTHPIDYRYGDPRLRELFTPENIIRTYSRIEAKVAEVQARMGMIPQKAVEPIKNSVDQITYKEVKQKEAEIKHDIMAVVKVMAEKAGKWGEYIHWGLTSADIKDTTKVILTKQALPIIKEKLKENIKLLGQLAYKYQELPCVGRTHGIHANVYLFGRKFAVFAAELLRNLERIQESEKRLYVGKIAGSVGTHTVHGKKGEKIEEQVLNHFGLSPTKIATQVISRDRFAELFSHLALLSTSLEKIAVEIRNLQRTEINELAESFHEDQIGSSAMPHKRNPIKSENITGLARIIRSLLIAGLENNVLWHERDLSNSGPERALFPEVFLLLSEQLKKLTSILEGIQIHKKNIKENLWLTKGLIFSERLTMKLAEKIGRQKAHEIVKKTAMQAYRQDRNFKEVVKQSKISQHLPNDTIEALFNPHDLIKVAKSQTEHVIDKIETELNTRIKE